MAITEVVLTGVWTSPDRDVLAGDVLLSLTGGLRDATDGLVVPAESFHVYLDENGAIAVQVYATDDPDCEPSGRQYYVRERIIGASERSYYLDVPRAPEGSRTVLDAVTISGSLVVTSATAVFVNGDVGKYVTSPQLPALTKIASRTNATTVVLSAQALTSASGIQLVIGASQGLAAA